MQILANLKCRFRLAGSGGPAQLANHSCERAGHDYPREVSTDPIPAPAADHFRLAMASFATGVTVVSTAVGEVDHAMTASAFSSVSLSPRLVLFCVERSARFHEAMMVSDTWAVSILDRAGQAASSWFATPGRPLLGQLDRVPHHRGPMTGHALLDDSLAALECRTTARYPAGDHTIVVGEVVNIELAANPNPADNPKPLLYYRGQYRHLADPT
jgi:flavin reductase